MEPLNSTIDIFSVGPNILFGCLCHSFVLHTVVFFVDLDYSLLSCIFSIINSNRSFYVIQNTVSRRRIINALKFTYLIFSQKCRWKIKMNLLTSLSLYIIISDIAFCCYTCEFWIIFKWTFKFINQKQIF